MENLLGMNLEYIQDAIKARSMFQITKAYKASEYARRFQENVLVVQDKAYETTRVMINSVEDRGEFFYVGYTDCKTGSWGYSKFHKDLDTQPFGVKIVVNLSTEETFGFIN